MSIQEMFDLSGKVALVTGGGRGIGKTIADVYGEAGAKLVITGRRDEWLTPTQEEFEAKGYQCLKVVADVSKPEDIERTVQAALDKFGQIDILVNNAGQTWGQPTVDLSPAKWQQIIDVNLNGVFLLTQQVGRHMIERGQGGRIVNIASVAGLLAADPDVASTLPYNTSKGALIIFTKALAREWGRNGILVNAIAPGWFPTRMASGLIEANREKFERRTSLGRIGELDDLKGLALFLASPASSYITGQTIVIDGGASI
jgi:NAD(P)-dependent dehydrogenase (short-subunit alcohol dehydrogenase family)